jgi:hypothetical protein
MTETHTPGPWRSIIDDTGGQWSGWPLCIVSENGDDKSVVRTGGQWPYEWDAATSQREAVANARLIAAAPDYHTAAREIDRLALVIESAVRFSDPTNLAAVRAALKANQAAIAKATTPNAGERG